MVSDFAAGLRGMVEMPVEHGVWPVLAWSLAPGERVSQAIAEAAGVFARENGVEAQFAFMWEIPAGGEEFAEIGEVTLVQADWAPVGFVVLACGGMTRIIGEFQHWVQLEVLDERG